MKTAVEWLIEYIHSEQYQIAFGKTYISIELVEQAKEMEKEHIINAYKAAEDKSDFFEYEHRYGREYLTAEPYYNETFKPEQ